MSYLGPAEIAYLLLLLKSWSARGASLSLAFMVLVLIKGISRRGESNISFGYSIGLRASFQTHCERGESDTGGPSSVFNRMEYLFASQF